MTLTHSADRIKRIISHNVQAPFHHTTGAIMTHRLIGLTAVLLLTIALPSAAQRQRSSKLDREQQRQEHQQLRADLRAWFTTEVAPTLRQWQQAFDAGLTAEERATLLDLRSQASTIRESVRQEMERLRDDRSELDRDELREQLHSVKAEHREQMQAIMARLKPLAKTHRDRLRELFDTNEEQIDAWRAHVDDLRDKAGRRGRGHGKDPGEMGLLMGDGRSMAMKFLLWDGQVPPAELMPKGQLQDGRPQNPLRVAPNPASHSAAVRTQGLANGPAKIEIFDMNGTLVRTSTATVANGSLNTTVPTDGLAPGRYMVSVNASDGRRSAPLLINP